MWPKIVMRHGALFGLPAMSRRQGSCDELAASGFFREKEKRVVTLYNEGVILQKRCSCVDGQAAGAGDGLVGVIDGCCSQEKEGKAILCKKKAALRRLGDKGSRKRESRRRFAEDELLCSHKNEERMGLLQTLSQEELRQR